MPAASPVPPCQQVHTPRRPKPLRHQPEIVYSARVYRIVRVQPPRLRTANKCRRVRQKVWLRQLNGIKRQRRKPLVRHRRLPRRPRRQKLRPHDPQVNADAVRLKRQPAPIKDGCHPLRPPLLPVRLPPFVTVLRLLPLKARKQRRLQRRQPAP